MDRTQALEVIRAALVIGEDARIIEQGLWIWNRATDELKEAAALFSGYQGVDLLLTGERKSGKLHGKRYTLNEDALQTLVS